MQERIPVSTKDKPFNGKVRITKKADPKKIKAYKNSKAYKTKKRKTGDAPFKRFF